MAFLAALAMAPTSGHALLFEYDYRGPTFQTAAPPYTTSDFVRVWFSIELPRNTDLPFEDYALLVQAFTFSDGVQTITQNDATSDLLFQFQTDAAGDLTSWLVRVAVGERQISTMFEFDQLVDSAQLSDTSSALVSIFNAEPAGTWSQGAKIPEPPTLWILLISLFLLAVSGAANPRAMKPAH